MGNQSSSGKISHVALHVIRADTEIQARAAVHPDAVTEYSERMHAGDKFPPLVLFYDGTDHWLADGFHRLQAAKSVPLSTFECVIYPGGRAEAEWYGLGANRANGLRMSNADKERAVKRALRARPAESDSAIAKHVGVSDKTVAKYRAELSPGSEFPSLGSEKLGRRIGQDGKHYPATRQAVTFPPPPEFPRLAPSEPPPPLTYSAPPPPLDELLPGPPPPPLSPPPPPLPDDGARRDRFGRAIVGPQLNALFDRDDELLGLIRQLDQIKKHVVDSCAVGDQLYAYITPAAFEVDINNVRRALQHTRPYCICGYCMGEGCRACMKRGAANQTTHEMHPDTKRG